MDSLIAFQLTENGMRPLYEGISRNPIPLAQEGEFANSTMDNQPIEMTKRLLEPNERVAEVLFGLIMVLTFTGSLSVAEADRGDVRAMLIGAIGCNIAWGFIDGIMYLLNSLAAKGGDRMLLHKVHQSIDPQTAYQHIKDSLPSVVVSSLQPSELESIHQRLKSLPEPRNRERLDKSDLLGAIGVFLLVFFSTFPVVVPFLFVRDAGLAMRISNGIAIFMLFWCGYAYGKCVHLQPWLIGIVMVLFGSFLVGLTIALGG